MEYTKEQCYDFLIENISFDPQRDFSGIVHIRGDINIKNDIDRYVYESVRDKKNSDYKNRRISQLKEELRRLNEG